MAGPLAALAIALAVGGLLPAAASATDSDLKQAFAFRVDGSYGYSILALAANERADGRGQIVLFVTRGDTGATYLAPAVLTASSVQADLGPLGEVSLAVAPSGVRKRLRSGCGDESGPATVEPFRYHGNFEFHGEQAYTDAATDAPVDYTRFFLRSICAGVGGGEVGGDDLPGARLRLHARRGSYRLSLQANKNGPRARTRLEVEVHEERDRIRISRSTSLWADAGVFRYDPLLRTATLNPSAPFSGSARFTRRARAANRWTGDLTVDLPGRSDVPLSSGRTRATLVHSCWQGEGAGGPAIADFDQRVCHVYPRRWGTPRLPRSSSTIPRGRIRGRGDFMSLCGKNSPRSTRSSRRSLGASTASSPTGSCGRLD
jgi:hypothetical protein